ncbi:pyridoxal phosphate-dependent aminotransferase [Infirmifilum lucidum]|uniref:pyridoxal phosphate-dependent aminotransferase n=1 Tax=Infirmifilum lucidum TaxID=2776706 RepID=UPI001CEC5AD9|nr:pyridoxal phosphate-dependent aminotransferase [Infirmifilum lucidum]
MSSPIRRIAALLDEARRKGDIISFGGGAPSLPPPQEVVEYIAEALKRYPQKTVAYGSTRGMIELRELISQDLKKYWGVSYDPHEEIMIVNGGTEGIYLALGAILEPGDEVILIDPTYVGYSEPIRLFGGRVRYVPVRVEEGYQPKIEDLEKVVSPLTKAFILLSPDNPTGRIVTDKFVSDLVRLAKEHDFWIIFDAVYKHITYGRQTPWVDAYPGARERTITIHSFSKEASIPGFRLGYVTGPPEVIEAMEKIKQYVSLAPDTPGQIAMIKFYENGIKERYLNEVVIPTYRRRRDFMYKAIQEYLPEAKTTLPEGAFYFFVDLRPYLEAMGRDDEEFANRLLYRKSVVVIPGKYFGEMGKGHVRMTFVSESEERIEEGLKRMNAYITSYL